MKASFLRHMAVCDLFLIYVPISLKSGIHVQYNHVNPELQWSLLESGIDVVSLPESGISVGPHVNSGFR